MAKLSREDVIKEIEEKGYKLAEDSPEYKNLISEIKVSCKNNHFFITNLKSIRSANFYCPTCVGQKSKGFDNEPLTIPRKTGYRIIGFDNATQKMGVSIFDDGKLVYYTLLKFDNYDHVKRLNKIRSLLEDVIIQGWEPDFLQIEDIQHQSSYYTYEILIKLVGLFEMSADRFAKPLEKTRSNVWRSHFGINGRDRNAEKKKAIDLVKKMYNIDVQDDIAEAILIGKYRVDLMGKSKLAKLF